MTQPTRTTPELLAVLDASARDDLPQFLPAEYFPDGGDDLSEVIGRRVVLVLLPGYPAAVIDPTPPAPTHGPGGNVHLPAAWPYDLAYSPAPDGWTPMFPVPALGIDERRYPGRWGFIIDAPYELEADVVDAAHEAARLRTLAMPIAAAWNIPGQHRRYHDSLKGELNDSWPNLARAIAALARHVAPRDQNTVQPR